MSGQESNQTQSIENSEIDNADDTVHSIDISSYSDYLPYSNYDLPDSTLAGNDDQIIQVITGNRQNDWKPTRELPRGWNPRDNNITIHRDNRQMVASMLPTLFVTNHR